jgi:phosphoenolpyruvate carboxykinase (GTP)
MTGLKLPAGTLEKLLSIDRKEWLEELKGINKFFRLFKKHLPKELWQEFEELKERLKAP